jgi:hypothetical protein
MRVRRVNAQRLPYRPWWRRSEVGLFIELTRAREYQIVLGCATDGLPPQTKSARPCCPGRRAMRASAHAPFFRLPRLLGCAAVAG